MSSWNCSSIAWLASFAVWLAAASLEAADNVHGSESAAHALAGEALPLLRRHCWECHGAFRAESGLRLDSRATALDGGGSGPVILPGAASASELVRRVALPRDDVSAMPPHGPGLTPQEVAVVRSWIDQGAAWPEEALNAAHWSFVPPVKRPPAQEFAAANSEIDAYVAEVHAREGLAFAPPAAPAALARRVSFDLTGLPPAPHRVAHLANSWSEEAYVRFVDELLASEEFGVRWARMWLDLARYADSHGFQRDDLRPLWAYRDWVVDAFNADMPFDRFTIMQLAGDLLPDADEQARIATGFHRCAPTNVEAGTDPEESRINQVFDRVNTTGATWLGVTLECAQCHDHKYDPISQLDYYRLLAYFNSTEAEAAREDPQIPGSIRFVGPAMPLTHDPWAAERAELRARLATARSRLQQLAEEEDPAAKTPGKSAEAGGASSEPQSGAEPTTLPAEVRRLEKEWAALPAAETLVMRELPRGRPTYVLHRGEISQPGAAVEAGTPPALGPAAEAPANRLSLARWLVSREHPLTARVLVNRIWHEVFGRGLAPTVEDFGLKGEPPTHPKLLDALACDLMDDHWSLKRLLRRIVLSRTYRQESQVTKELFERDPHNAWLARGPRFRLSAEAIRDNALEIAGLLSRAKGGPSVRPPQPPGLWDKVGGEKYRYEVSPGEQKYRRGLYVVLKRGSPYPSFMAFDASSRMTCVVKRSRSNTPLQALVLLNDPVYVEAALAFARRVLVDLPQAPSRARIDYAFRLALSRVPEPREIDVLSRLLADEQRDLAVRPEAAAELFAAYPDYAPPDAIGAAELAAWYAVTTAILSLDETITKG